jgi:hypothetical protein
MVDTTPNRRRYGAEEPADFPSPTDAGASASGSIRAVK